MWGQKHGWWLFHCFDNYIVLIISKPSQQNSLPLHHYIVASLSFSSDIIKYLYIPVIVIKDNLAHVNYSAKRNTCLLLLCFRGIYLCTAVDVHYKITFCFFILWRTSIKKKNCKTHICPFCLRTLWQGTLRDTFISYSYTPSICKISKGRIWRM